MRRVVTPFPRRYRPLPAGVLTDCMGDYPDYTINCTGVDFLAVAYRNTGTETIARVQLDLSLLGGVWDEAESKREGIGPGASGVMFQFLFGCKYVRVRALADANASIEVECMGIGIEL